MELEVRIFRKVDEDAPQIDIDIVQDLGKASRENEVPQRGHFE